MEPTRAIPCPVCEAPARVLDSSPSVEWLMIEGCACAGYRVRADLVATRRLKKLPPGERRQIQARIQALHANGEGAWLDTEAPPLRGPLVVLSAPPR
jgi:hypothetical protein